jgi:hypothetical protein
LQKDYEKFKNAGKANTNKTKTDDSKDKKKSEKDE